MSTSHQAASLSTTARTRNSGGRDRSKGVPLSAAFTSRSAAVNSSPSRWVRSAVVTGLGAVVWTSWRGWE